MNRFKVAPEVEVTGAVVLAVVDVMGAFGSVARRILAENGIADPLPDRWYPLRSWLASFDTIVKDVGPNTLHMIGRHVAATAPVPPHVNTPELALITLDDAYHSQHKGGDVGHFHYIPSGERSGTMVSSTPYPSDFDRGVIMALAERLAPERYADVRLDASAESRKDGGETCTFLISW
ncbi:MAG: DUF2378 family protein [Holophagales bacterium]|nr:DUF2378 family protein [Holophagales bacterium]